MSFPSVKGEEIAFRFEFSVPFLLESGCGSPPSISAGAEMRRRVPQSISASAGALWISHRLTLEKALQTIKTGDIYARI